MKKKLIYLISGIGLILWLWVGSYVAMRQSTKQTLWNRLVINGTPVERYVEIPAWMEPVKFIYRPLAAIDQQITGQRVQVGNWRIHIGATANF